MTIDQQTSRWSSTSAIHVPGFTFHVQVEGLHFFFSTRRVSDVFLHAEHQRGVSLRAQRALLFFFS
jgi:hypothetical protein